MTRAGPDIEDALNPRMVGTTEGMTLQVLAQIRDSLSAMSRDIRTNNEATADVRERVIRLEERDRRLEDLEHDVQTISADVQALKTDKDRRDGAVNFLGKLPNWVAFAVTLASVFSALWLFGRSLGVVPAPPTDRQHVEAVIQPDERSIKGTVGGKEK